MNPTLPIIGRMTILFFVLSILFSCGKDTDLLLDSVLYEPEVSLERKNYTDVPADEAGFVLRTYTFSPTYDAYLQENQGYNYEIIRLQEEVRTSYLMFDLSQIDGPITDAVLQFYVDSDEGDGDIRIHQGSITDWTEENLNSQNAPKLVSELGSINKAYLVGDAEKIALNTENLTAERTTLVLSHQKGNDLAFASKEHPSNRGPKLIVTYRTEEDTPAIEQEEVQQEVEETTQPKTDTPSADYYVTTTGKASNDGLTEATAWSIQHAFDRAIAGDVVYVKAGNYGNINLIADNSGTPNKLIKFIGYTNTPGDVSSENSSTFNYGDNLDATKMPLIQGLAPNGKGEGIGITAIESYVHIENFQITKFEFGLFAKGNQSTYKNIIVTNVGDFNPAHSYPSATSDSHLNYFGNGIVVSGNNSELLNSFVLNSGAQAITFNNCNEITARNNKVYSDNNINPTDYYFLIGENTLNSKFINTTVHRVGELEHLGHGIVFKGNGLINGNLVDGFEITNTVLEAQFPYTRNNTFRNGTITKEANINVTTPNVSGIRLANGTGNNIFEDIVLTNCSVNFHDWKDGLKGDVSDASDDNILRRITVKDAFSAIAFAYFQVENHASSADNNIFEDCTFTNIEHLFEVDRANSNTRLKNCTINGVNNLYIERIPGGPSYPLDAYYENCTWTNVNFTPPN
jgi:hypothetical protein